MYVCIVWDFINDDVRSEVSFLIQTHFFHYTEMFPHKKRELKHNDIVRIGFMG